MRQALPRRSARGTASLVVLLASLTLVFAEAQRGITPTTTAIQLLAINDFHGNLEPASGETGAVHGTPAGGAEYLATHLKHAAARNPNTIIVAAGDLVGATPLLSAASHDEPTIESMNAMNLSVTSVGNHEFDHGVTELLRLQKGGCHAKDGCRPGETFTGAKFQYLSANVVRTATGRTLFPATAIRTVGGVKIGFIGETLRGTNHLVIQSGIAGLSFLDEATTANAYAARLKRQGADAVVLLIHQGGRQKPSDDAADPNGCDDFSGGITPILRRLSPAIQLIVSGHAHRWYNCAIGGRTITNTGAYGRAFTSIDMTVDPSADRITSIHATNHVVTRDVEKDPVQTQIIAKYGALSNPIANRVVGAVTSDIIEAENESGESALGDVVADSQLESARPPNAGNAAVAFINPGGMRADIVPAAGGSVRFGDLFGVLPYNNVIVTVTMTGEVLVRLLEQQFDNPGPGRATILQASEGFSYKYARKASHGRHVVRGSLRLAGRLIATTDRIRVATNNFLLEGGDNFTVFRRGTNRTIGQLDLDALVAYFASHSPVAPGPKNRITRVD